MDDLKNNSIIDNDPFLSSVDALSSKDIVVSAKKKLVLSPSMIARICLVLIFSGIFLYSLYLLLERGGEYSRADKLYDQIADLWNDSSYGLTNPFGSVQYASKDTLGQATVDFAGAQNKDDSQGPSINEEVLESSELIAIKAKMNALKIQNKDTVAWITIPGTNIDYPVVLCDNNEYYLTHSFDRTYSIAGTLFADRRNKADLEKNYNTIIYGHNLMSGKMFSELDKFFTKSFFNTYKNIYIYTENGIYVYEVFNVTKMSIEVDYIQTRFELPKDFIEFGYAMKAHSIYQKEIKDVQFGADDRILTLSTCTNAHNAAERYCIQAKLVEIKK